MMIQHPFRIAFLIQIVLAVDINNVKDAKSSHHASRDPSTVPSAPTMPTSNSHLNPGMLQHLNIFPEPSGSRKKEISLNGITEDHDTMHLPTDPNIGKEKENTDSIANTLLNPPMSPNTQSAFISPPEMPALPKFDHDDSKVKLFPGSDHKSEVETKSPDLGGVLENFPPWLNQQPIDHTANLGPMLEDEDFFDRQFDYKSYSIDGTTDAKVNSKLNDKLDGNVHDSNGNIQNVEGMNSYGIMNDLVSELVSGESDLHKLKANDTNGLLHDDPMITKVEHNRINDQDLTGHETENSTPQNMKKGDKSENIPHKVKENIEEKNHQSMVKEESISHPPKSNHHNSNEKETGASMINKNHVTNLSPIIPATDHNVSHEPLKLPVHQGIKNQEHKVLDNRDDKDITPFRTHTDNDQQLQDTQRNAIGHNSSHSKTNNELLNNPETHSGKQIEKFKDDKFEPDIHKPNAEKGAVKGIGNHHESTQKYDPNMSWNYFGHSASNENSNPSDISIPDSSSHPVVKNTPKMANETNPHSSFSTSKLQSDNFIPKVDQYSNQLGQNAKKEQSNNPNSSIHTSDSKSHSLIVGQNISRLPTNIMSNDNSVETHSSLSTVNSIGRNLGSTTETHQISPKGNENHGMSSNTVTGESSIQKPRHIEMHDLTVAPHNQNSTKSFQFAEKEKPSSLNLTEDINVSTGHVNPKNMSREKVDHLIVPNENEKLPMQSRKDSEKIKFSHTESSLHNNSRNFNILENSSNLTYQGMEKYDQLMAGTLDYLKDKDSSFKSQGSACGENELYLLDKDKLILLTSGSLAHEITGLRNFEDNLLMQIRNQESIISTLKSRIQAQEKKNENLVSVTKTLRSNEESMKKELSLNQDLLITSRHRTEQEMARSLEMSKKVNKLELQNQELISKIAKKDQQIKDVEAELSRGNAAFQVKQLREDIDMYRKQIEEERKTKSELEETLFNLISNTDKEETMNKTAGNTTKIRCTDRNLLKNQISEQDERIHLLIEQNQDLARTAEYFNGIVINKDKMVLSLQDQIKNLLSHDISSIQTCLQKDELIKVQYESIDSLKSLSFCQDKYAQARETALNILRETIYKMTEKIPACGNIATDGLKKEMEAMTKIVEPMKNMVEKLHKNVESQLNLSQEQWHNQDVIDSMKKILEDQVGALDKCQLENKSLVKQMQTLAKSMVDNNTENK